MSELEIIALREKYNEGSEYPLAFEEFLNISGKVCHIGIDTDYEGIFEDFMELIGSSPKLVGF